MSQDTSWNVYGGTPAEVYERYLAPAIFRPWAELLLDLAVLRPGERVLDVACGTGVVARRAVEKVGAAGRVTGLDINTDMLAMARSSHAEVEWREASALAMPFPDESFDVVLCQQGLRFFPDRIGRAA